MIESLNNCRANAVERLHKPKSGEVNVVKTNGGDSKCLCRLFSDDCCDNFAHYTNMNLRR